MTARPIGPGRTWLPPRHPDPGYFRRTISSLGFLSRLVLPSSSVAGPADPAGARSARAASTVASRCAPSDLATASSYRLSRYRSRRYVPPDLRHRRRQPRHGLGEAGVPAGETPRHTADPVDFRGRSSSPWSARPRVGRERHRLAWRLGHRAGRHRLRTASAAVHLLDLLHLHHLGHHHRLIPGPAAAGCRRPASPPAGPRTEPSRRRRRHPGMPTCQPCRQPRPCRACSSSRGDTGGTLRRPATLLLAAASIAPAIDLTSRHHGARRHLRHRADDLVTSHALHPAHEAMVLLGGGVRRHGGG